MPTASHEHKITKSASVVGIATAISRVSGYTRDACIAYVFGAGIYSDAFFVAFRIANLFRRLLGEGALTSSFIPIFTEERLARDRHGAQSLQGANALVASVMTLFTLILIVLSVLGIIFSKELVWLMSPGFASDPEKFAVTVNLTRLMFPYMIFVGLMAIAMGVLNSFKHFAAPAIAPVFFNLSIILAVFVVTPLFVKSVYALSIGVLLGGLLQFVVQIPFLRKYGISIRPLFKFSDPALKKIFLLMLPAAFGVGVYQLNIFVTLWFASKLEGGSVSYLYYAGRVMELPIGIFSVAVATATLPSLSEHVVKGEWDAFKKSLAFSLRIVNFVTIPATVGLVALSFPIVETLFMRGQFNLGAASATSAALSFYAIGLVPVSACRLLSAVFYSLKDTVTPVWIAFASFIVNVILCILLIEPLQYSGLALATSLSSFVNMFGLFIMLRRRFGAFGGKFILVSALKSSAASLVTGVVVYAMVTKLGYAGMGPILKPVFIAFTVVAGVLTYIGTSRVFRSPELPFLKTFLQR